MTHGTLFNTCGGWMEGESGGEGIHRVRLSSVLVYLELMQHPLFISYTSIQKKKFKKKRWNPKQMASRGSRDPFVQLLITVITTTWAMETKERSLRDLGPVQRGRLLWLLHFISPPRSLMLGSASLVNLVACSAQCACASRKIWY